MGSGQPPMPGIVGREELGYAWLVSLNIISNDFA
jgi:hypothetical protein